MAVEHARQLETVTNRLKAVIRRNTDRGFIHYDGFDDVCDEMTGIIAESHLYGDRRLAFEVLIAVLSEFTKLLDHADSSSGAASEVVGSCLSGIEALCLSASEEDHRAMLDTILKAVKKKPFQTWQDNGYGLLKAAIPLVHDKKQQEKVYSLFEHLGPLYEGKKHPDAYVIVYRLTERLEGAAAAEQFIQEHLQVGVIREIAVNKAIAAEQYALAEQLCLEVVKPIQHGRTGQTDRWAKQLERIYTLTGNEEKLTETIRHLLLSGDTAYYSKLKERRERSGEWEQERESVLLQLSERLWSREYADLLSAEQEYERLIEVIDEHLFFIVDYGKALAKHKPIEAYALYEKYITAQAMEATDRRKYKSVCRSIRSYSAAGAKEEAIALAQRLMAAYPRRQAMLEELENILAKLTKPKSSRTSAKS